MIRPDVVIFHRAPAASDPPLTRLLAAARDALVAHQTLLFRAAGAGRILLVDGREAAERPAAPVTTFGRRLADTVRAERIERVIVLGSGAVPLLRAQDARALLAAASAPGRLALTNNRYSSDVCAISDASALRDLPPLPSDNALPRWLEGKAGFRVAELSGRERLALDLDSPLDLAVLALSARPPAAVVDAARTHGIAVPRLEQIRSLVVDARRELLVFGRTGSSTLRWLERNARCRVRFLAEERGLRASSPLATDAATQAAETDADPPPGAAGAPPDGDPPPRDAGSPPDAGSRPASRRPRATLGRLLDARGPAALAELVAELADGAIIDTRVLMADRSGADEAAWPDPEDRFASDLHRIGDVRDSWLRELTASAAGSEQPILLGAHTLVGPGIPLVCAPDRRPRPTRTNRTSDTASDGLRHA